jgi:hypothetical protein
MTRVDDERLMAYLDGELDERGRAEVEQALAGDVGLRNRLGAQRRLRNRLAGHYDPVAQEAVPDRFRAILDPPIVDLTVAREQRRPGSRPQWQNFAAIAATLVLGILLGRSLPGDSGPVTVESGVMIAQASLADALDTQLASAQPAGAPTRMGVSFARADGRLCRTFESAAVAGLACRSNQGWQLIMTAAGAKAARSEYRQAGGGNAAVLQVAQEMMVGEPFGAEAERRARDSGWRNMDSGD